MSSADLYEDGFPHGTKEGYDRGCRGAACPEGLEGHQTCATAKSRYNGDYAYRKLVDSGLTPEQIRDAEKPATPAKATPKLHLVDAKPVARPKPPAPTPVAAEIEQWPDDEPDLRAVTVDVTVDPITGKTIPLEEHGTYKGYKHGCRDINCAGVARVGNSCRAANNDYQRAAYRARVERAKQAASEATAARDADVTLPINHDSLELAHAEEATPTAVDEEPADDVAPELSDDELAHVTAFGLHEPEQETPALAEWDEIRQLEYAEQLRDRDEKIRHLERELHWYQYQAEKRVVAPEPQRLDVLTETGRAVTITIVVGS